MKKVNLLLLLFFCTINAQIALPTFQAVHTPHPYTANEQLNYAVYTSTSSYYASTYQDIIDNQGSQEASGTTSSIGGPSSSTYGLINFTSQTHLEAVVGNVSNDNFSLTVSGYFIPQESGTYTFTCEGDDGVFFLLNGSVVASHPGGHGTSSIGNHTGTISLTAGTKYTLNAYMQEKGGGIGLRVFWKTPSNSTWTIHADEISSE
ncbi:MAG TPA: hypothetical protein EYO45_09585 [Candidatus Marinimicrobia bacterium]|nr:hypothetical protein [Candidatus Neomarinimicrobiota bacterium]